MIFIISYCSSTINIGKYAIIPSKSVKNQTTEIVLRNGKYDAASEFQSDHCKGGGRAEWSRDPCGRPPGCLRPFTAPFVRFRWPPCGPPPGCLPGPYCKSDSREDSP